MPRGEQAGGPSGGRAGYFMVRFGWKDYGEGRAAACAATATRTPAAADERTCHTYAICSLEGDHVELVEQVVRDEDEVEEEEEGANRLRQVEARQQLRAATAEKGGVARLSPYRGPCAR